MRTNKYSLIVILCVNHYFTYKCILNVSCALLLLVVLATLLYFALVIVLKYHSFRKLSDYVGVIMIPVSLIASCFVYSENNKNLQE